MSRNSSEEQIDNIRPERLPSRANFIEWYNALLSLADIADRSYPVKGTFIWMPYGLKMIKKITRIFDGEFQRAGIEEVLFPLFVTLNFAKQNDKWFEGFREEAFYIEGKELLLRPTGEPAMYPIFKSWIRQGKLPIKVYQTVNSYRNESKTTHTMIRDREITFWHEVHTVHKTRAEAVEEAERHREIYTSVWKDVLNIPPITVAKPKYEIFAGADSAFEFYTILPDGRLLENGSVNNLGQAYAKKFEVCYTNDKGESEYAWQVCTGNGARFIAAVIAIHGDDRGLVLSPKIAPIPVVIVPIVKSGNKESVMREAKQLSEKLQKELGIDAYLDDSEKTPGEKYHIWEIKGVPVRIEFGEKEIKEGYYTIFRRDSNSKHKVEKKGVVEEIGKLLEHDIPKGLLSNAEKVYEDKIKMEDGKDAAKRLIGEGKVVKAHWCEGKECFDAISAFGPSIEAIGTLVYEKGDGKCIICQKRTDKLTLIGRTY